MKVEYLILKEENTYCGSKEAFLSLLVSNEDLKINGNTLKYKKNDIKITIQTDVPQLIDKKERYFHLLLEKDTNEKNVESIILLIQEVCKIIKTIIYNSNYGFRINTLWDDISFYYSKQSYPLINEIENLNENLNENQTGGISNDAHNNILIYERGNYFSRRFRNSIT